MISLLGKQTLEYGKSCGDTLPEKTKVLSAKKLKYVIYYKLLENKRKTFVLSAIAAVHFG